MVTQQLREWAEQRDYTLVQGENLNQEMYARRLDGYTFTLCCEEDANKSSMAGSMFGVVGMLAAGAAVKCYRVKAAVEDATWNKAVLKELKQELKKKVEPSYQKGVLTLQAKKAAHNDQTYAMLEEAMETAAGLLERADVRPAAGCPLCERDCGDDFTAVYRPVLHARSAHPECVDRHAEQLLEKLEKKRSGSFLLGLLGAVIGGAVGAVPAAIFVMAGFYASVLNFLAYLLVPVAAYSGFRRGSGKTGLAAIPVVAAVSALAVTALVVWGDFMWVRTEFEIPLRLYLYEAMSDVEYLAGLLLELAISYGAAIVGVVAGWMSARKHDKHSDELHESLRRRLARSSAPGQ